MREWFVIRSNAYAFARGILLKLTRSRRRRNVRIGNWARVFRNVSFRIYKGSKCTIGDKIKVGSNTTIAATKGADLFIGNNVGIGENSYIICRHKISIGEDTMLAQNVLVYDHDHRIDASNIVFRTEYELAPVSIGKNCWIGANTIILRGTVIGDNCIVGAGCVLKGTYPQGSRIVQKRSTTIIS